MKAPRESSQCHDENLDGGSRPWRSPEMRPIQFRLPFPPPFLPMEKPARDIARGRSRWDVVRWKDVED
jgi:hypothetical protein